jgi:MutL protein
MTVSAGPEAPAERTRVAVGRPLRLALLSGRADASRGALARIALAAGAEPVAVVPTTDARSFVEIAQAFRDAAPHTVIVHGDAKDAARLAELLEALRLGCGAQRPAPRIVALADDRVFETLRPPARPFVFERAADPGSIVRALRDQRRSEAEGVVLRDELVEDAARSLAASTAVDALVVDVSERTTSLVLARADGRLDAAHLVPLGLGAAADRVVAHAGLDRVRRWLPWAIDAPALLERVFNRARWPDAVPATEAAVLLEMALAREAIAHALRDARQAGLDVAAMRAAASILVAGRAASFPRPGQSLLVVVDGLEPSGVSTVFREPDDGGAERVAMVVSFSPRRAATLRFTRAVGRSEELVARGSFVIVPLTGAIGVAAKGAPVRGHGHAGALGVLVDARGRPLSLPERDGERIPAVSRWHSAVRALTTAAPS